MPKTRKDYRLSEDTLKRIAECQKQLGLESETAVVEIMLKIAHDQLIKYVDQLTDYGRNDPTE
jgi:hypothetical protein